MESLICSRSVSGECDRKGCSHFEEHEKFNGPFKKCGTFKCHYFDDDVTVECVKVNSSIIKRMVNGLLKTNF
jgi:hypothetical protein